MIEEYLEDTGASFGPGSRAREKEWRPISGFEGIYEVSSDGRVRSLRFNPSREIGAGSDKDGYPIVRLYRGGHRKTVALHRVVCVAFHGPQPNILHREVAHLDGDRRNCHASNLKWCGKIENTHHKRLHGTYQVGDAAGNRKLTSSDVAYIRSAKGTVRAAELAGNFGVSRHAIYDIWQRKNWA